jgi:hypothetical protein
MNQNLEVGDLTWWREKYLLHGENGRGELVARREKERHLVLLVDRLDQTVGFHLVEKLLLRGKKRLHE